MQLFPARDENTRVEIARNIAFSFDRHDDFFRSRVRSLGVARLRNPRSELNDGKRRNLFIEATWKVTWIVELVFIPG